MDFLTALPTVLANIVQDYDKDTENFDCVVTELGEIVGRHRIPPKVSKRGAEIRRMVWWQTISDNKEDGWKW